MDTIFNFGLPSRSRRFTGRSTTAGGPLRRVVHGLLALLVLWQQRVADRECLRAMDVARLYDTGINRIDALCEADKPFWRS